MNKKILTIAVLGLFSNQSFALSSLDLSGLFSKADFSTNTVAKVAVASVGLLSATVAVNNYFITPGNVEYKDVQWPQAFDIYANERTNENLVAKSIIFKDANDTPEIVATLKAGNNNAEANLYTVLAKNVLGLWNVPGREVTKIEPNSLVCLADTFMLVKGATPEAVDLAKSSLSQETLKASSAVRHNSNNFSIC